MFENLLNITRRKLDMSLHSSTITNFLDHVSVDFSIKKNQTGTFDNVFPEIQNKQHLDVFREII